jgi:hypothetical protein
MTVFRWGKVFDQRQVALGKKSSIHADVISCLPSAAAKILKCSLHHRNLSSVSPSTLRLTRQTLCVALALVITDPVAAVLLASMPSGRRLLCHAERSDNTEHERTGADASCSKISHVPMRASD